MESKKYGLRAYCPNIYCDLWVVKGEKEEEKNIVLASGKTKLIGDIHIFFLPFGRHMMLDGAKF